MLFDKTSYANKKFISLRVAMNLIAALVLVVGVISCGGGTNPTSTLAPPGSSGPSNQSGWFWQNPLPKGNALFSVSFTSANTGTAVGTGGVILRTTDGGTTWVNQASGSTETLLAVSFTDVDTGTAVGEIGTILRTTDEGN